MENELDNPHIAATMGFSAFGMPPKGLLHQNKAKKKNKKHLHSSFSKSEEATPASGASTTAFPHPEAPASNPAFNRPRKRSREAAFTATTSPAVGLTSSQGPLSPRSPHILFLLSPFSTPSPSFSPLLWKE